MKTIYRIIAITLLINSHQAYSQSNIVINEIMYNQKGNDTLEFVELFNKGAVAVNLTGYSFTQGIDFTFPNYTLNAGGYVVISRYSTLFNTFFTTTSFQWGIKSLSNSGDKIVLKDPTGTIVDSVSYETSYTWDKQANGNGASLSLCDATKNNELGFNWSAQSNNFAGIYNNGPIWATPGKVNTDCNAPGDIFPPRIKKASAENTTTVRIKFDEPVTLSSAQNTANYTGLGAITSATRNDLDSVTLILASPLTIGQVDSLAIANIKDTTSVGNTIIPKKVAIVFNNTIADLVITEIFYDNIGTDTLEFVEVYNHGSSTAIVGGYKFTDGIDFNFPTLTIVPGAFVAIPLHKTVFNSFFNKSATFDFSGSLSNTGEKLTIKNTTGDVIDSLTYLPQAPSGSSLILCNLSSDNNVKSNWKVSGDFAGSFFGEDVWASPGAASVTCLPLGILNSSSYKTSFKIYPNPAKDNFNIQFSDSKEREAIIMDSHGSIIMRTDFSDTHINIQTEKLKGLYFIQVIDKNQNTSETSKLVIE